jgi:hypothetical protein
MTAEWLAFARIGFGHIVNPEALDHILFLLALAAVYRLRDWKDALRVVTAFTIGHSLTLLLAVTGVVAFPSAVIEFLIPLTIVATAIDNIARNNRRPLVRAALAGAFGLIHGAGFANYLRSLFMDHVALPLFGFNVGIECGQLVVLAGIVALLTAADWVIARLRREPTLALRVSVVSAGVAIVAARWAVERAPW